MRVQLGDHFTYKKIFKLTIMPIFMMVFISLYSLADGIITNKVVGEAGFASTNLIWPVTMIIGGFGFMFGIGGAALASKRLGEGNQKGANNVFSNVVIAALTVGLVLSITCYFVTDPIVHAMASVTPNINPEIIKNAIIYGRILCFGQFAFILQNLFQSFFVVNERPMLGFLFSLIAGVTNIVFDLIFMIPCHMGVAGAATATIMGFIFSGVGSLIYFILQKNGRIKLTIPRIEFKAIGKSMLNGVSEFINNVAMSIVSIIFNMEALRWYGESGVIAYGVIQVVLLIFVGVFVGYSNSIAPAISYHYGAKNKDEIHNLFKKSFIFIICAAVFMLVFGEAMAGVLASNFSKDPGTIELATYAIRAWSVHFLFAGPVIFISNFFTALNDGLDSGICAIFRTFVFEISCIFILPIFFGEVGLWWMPVVSEFLGLALGVTLLIIRRKKYNY